MTDNPLSFEEAVVGGATPPEPPRLRFDTHVLQTFEAVVKALCNEVPELYGVAISLVWDPDLPATGLPYGTINARDPENLRFILRASEQTNKLLQQLTERYMAQLIAADAAAQDLNREIAEKRRQLNE